MFIQKNTQRKKFKRTEKKNKKPFVENVEFPSTTTKNKKKKVTTTVPAVYLV